MGGDNASQANKQEIRGSHTRNYHTCKRLPAQSWGLEPCGAVCSSLPHLSTPSKHVLGGPRKHCPGQEEAPRAPPSFLPGKQRQRASGWNRHPGTRDKPAPMGSSPSRDPPCTWCSLLSDSLSREEASPHPSFRQVPGEPDAFLRRWASKLATHAKEVVPEPTTGSCRSSCGGGVFLNRTCELEEGGCWGDGHGFTGLVLWEETVLV